MLVVPKLIITMGFLEGVTRRIARHPWRSHDRCCLVKQTNSSTTEEQYTHTYTAPGVVAQSRAWTVCSISTPYLHLGGWNVPFPGSLQSLYGLLKTAFHGPGQFWWVGFGLGLVGSGRVGLCGQVLSGSFRSGALSTAPLSE